MGGYFARAFILAILAISVTCGVDVNLPSPAKPCSKLMVRREIRQLNDNQLHEFLDALNAMKTSGAYDEFVQIHAKYIKKYHRTHNFLLYNRAFLLKFEKALKTTNPHLNLTIWDWSRDTFSPENSRIFTIFGGNGRKKDNCVGDGLVKNWKAHYPTGHCIKRNWDLGNKIKSFPPPEYIRAIIVRSKTCALLNEQVDLVIRHVHQSIGGDLYDVVTAINDPLYILSAAFADRIFADWEKIHDPESLFKYDYKRDELIEPFGMKIKDLVNTQSQPLCYEYSNLDQHLSAERISKIESTYAQGLVGPFY